MNNREARARIKIDKLLEKAGWRFFDGKDGSANIQLEQGVNIRPSDRDGLGEDFEKTKRGFIDYLLLDEKKYPLAVLEAKREDKNPLDGKEQARKYAHGLDIRFVILSNGNLHYFWDIEMGDPEVITELPRQESLVGCSKFKPNLEALYNAEINEDYIAVVQRPGIVRSRDWRLHKAELLEKYHDLRVLRPYQIKALQALQKAVQNGKQRFLFEMATGTGKTLLSAAVIKLFLRTENAKKVLFLVDRLELEMKTGNIKNAKSRHNR